MNLRGSFSKISQSFQKILKFPKIITTAQLHSTKPEPRFCAGLNPACSVSEIRDGEDLWKWFRLEIRLNASVNHTTETIYHHHHHRPPPTIRHKRVHVRVHISEKQALLWCSVLIILRMARLETLVRLCTTAGLVLLLACT